MMICSAFFGLLLVGMYVAIGVSLYRRRLLTAEALANGEDTRDTEAKLYLLTSVLFSFMAVTFVLQVRFLRLVLWTEASAAYDSWNETNKTLE